MVDVVAGLVVASAVSRWSDDPYSLGAWSLLRVGGSAATRAALGAPIAGRVIIAGEATHPDQAGMTHGAYEEGERAAQWCVASGHQRVIVVGAGIAGLAAAASLRREGLDVTVIDARERMGGRIRSVTLDGVAVELGANWLQQGERNPLRDVARHLAANLVPTDFHRPFDVDLRGGRHNESPNAAVRDAVAGEFMAEVATVGDVDASLQVIVDRLVDRRPERAAEIQREVDASVYLDAGAPLETLSAKFGFEPGVGDGDDWIVAGYGRILDHLSDGLDIRYNSPVRSIGYGSDAVEIRCGGRTFSADAAVVTIPIAVLKSSAVSFEPLLPQSHQACLDLLTAGRVEKVALVCSERFWPVSPSGYLRVFEGRERCVSEWLDLTDTVGRPVITGLFVGPWMEELWASTDDVEVAMRAADVLRRAAGVTAK